MENEKREQSEMAIIGALLAEPETVIRICVESGVSDHWFVDEGYAGIFATTRALFSSNELEGKDVISICQEAIKLVTSDEWKFGEKLTEEQREHKKPKRGGGFLEYSNWWSYVVKTIDGGCTSAGIGWHIHNVQTHVVKGRFMASVQKAMRTFDASPQEAMAILADCASECWKDVVGKKVTSKREICTALEADEYESWHMRVDPSNPDRDLEWVPGLKLPWPKLTRLYLGMGKRLHIIAARPSVGKTSFTINLMRYWADMGVKVYVNSLDMPMEDMIDRARTEKSRVSITKKRFTPTKEDLGRLQEASKWICESSIDVTEMYYVEDFCADLTMRARAGKLDVAVVDYVQLLNSYAVDNANEYERVSFVAEYLKRTANSFKIPVVALCQLNRSKEKSDDKEPTLADLRGSGALEQAASTVLLLHRDEQTVNGWRERPPHWFYSNEEYGKKHAAWSMDAVWAILLKNQNGPTGRLPFVVNKPYFCWKMGDMEAKAEKEEKRMGAVTIKKVDNSQKFARICRDWRKDSWEKDLEGKLVPYLIPGEDCKYVLIDEQQGVKL